MSGDPLVQRLAALGESRSVDDAGRDALLARLDASERPGTVAMDRVLPFGLAAAAASAFVLPSTPNDDLGRGARLLLADFILQLDEWPQGPFDEPR